MKLWQKGAAAHEKVDHFTVGKDREYDLVLAEYDCQASIAHANMLAKIGLGGSGNYVVVSKGTRNFKLHLYHKEGGKGTQLISKPENLKTSRRPCLGIQVSFQASSIA